MGRAACIRFAFFSRFLIFCARFVSGLTISKYRPEALASSNVVWLVRTHAMLARVADLSAHSLKKNIVIV